MPKSKYAPALFELLNSAKPSSVETAKVPSRDDHEEVAPVPEISAVCEPSAPRAAQPFYRESDSPAPWIHLDGPIVRLNLTSTMTALSLFVGLVLLLAAYTIGNTLGRRTGFQTGYTAGSSSLETAVPDEIERLKSGPAATHVVSDLTEPAGAPIPRNPQPASVDRAAGAGAVQWMRGYTYVVAQEFNTGLQEEAKRAQAFLAQHGIAASVVTLPSGAIQLVTNQGYNRKESGQAVLADDLLQRVQTVGEKYFTSGGRYRLKGYFRTLKSNSW